MKVGYKWLFLWIPLVGTGCLVFKNTEFSSLYLLLVTAIGSFLRTGKTTKWYGVTVHENYALLSIFPIVFVLFVESIVAA